MYDELVERLRAESYTLEELSIILPRAADAIEELTRRCEQFQYMPLPAWIPVTERLPEEGAEVLAWTESGFSYVDWCLDGKWKVNSLVDSKHEHVTHWMPLPEPPKEERR